MDSQSHSGLLRATGGAFHFDGSLKSFPVSVWLLPCLSLAASLEEKRTDRTRDETSGTAAGKTLLPSTTEEPFQIPDGRFASKSSSSSCPSAKDCFVVKPIFAPNCWIVGKCGCVSHPLHSATSSHKLAEMAKVPRFLTWVEVKYLCKKNDLSKSKKYWSKYLLK